MGLLLDLGYLLVALLTLPWFVYRLTVRGDWRSIPARLGIGLPPPTGGSIWLHGASAGEITLLQPLIRRLEADFPAVPLVVSAHSATGFTAAKKAYPEHRVIFLPADLSFIVRRFLRRFDPRLIVIVESDFWPNFLQAAHARKIPVAVVNGKMSDRSYRLHARTGLVPLLLRKVALFAVQSEEHATRLEKLGVMPGRIKVTGNMKYDLAGSADRGRAFSLREQLGYSPQDVVIIGGSLHDEENEALIDSYQRLTADRDDVALIVVPRYPTDVERVMGLVVDRDLEAVRKTELERSADDPPGRRKILIVDTVGELRALYGVADISFVGGSLFYRGSNKGGHNVIEPAILGVPVLFGPYNFSFQDTVEKLVEAEAGIEVADGTELRAALAALVTDETERAAMGERARDVILKEQGVTQRNYELMMPLLEIMREPLPPARFPVWSIFVYLLLPYALFTLLRRGLSYPAYWHRWPERFGYLPAMPEERTIWVHAVSVGEVRTASELVNSLADRYPGHRILVTTTTPTGSKQVRDLFGGRVSHAYVPYDLPSAVRRFMDRVNPEFAVIAETEFWPNLFGECGKRSVRLFLVNVRVSRTSLRGYRRFPRTSHAMLANADLLCAQTTRDAHQLEALGVSKRLIHVTGNLKFDVPVPESVIQEGERLRSDWGGNDRVVLIAASTHHGEERQILSAFETLRSLHSNLLLVVVPRHPERFNPVVRLCRRSGYVVARRTETPGQLRPDVDILVGDTMGELQKLYVASDVAFIGGSLVKVGGHNPLEACSVGVPVIFGPHMFHVEEVARMAVECGAGKQVFDVEELVSSLHAFISDPSSRERASGAARAFVTTNSGTLERTLRLIERTLESADQR